MRSSKRSFQFRALTARRSERKVRTRNVATQSGHPIRFLFFCFFLFSSFPGATRPNSHNSFLPTTLSPIGKASLIILLCTTYALPYFACRMCNLFLWSFFSSHRYFFCPLLSARLQAALIVHIFLHPSGLSTYYPFPFTACRGTLRYNTLPTYLQQKISPYPVELEDSLDVYLHGRESKSKSAGQNDSDES